MTVRKALMWAQSENRVIGRNNKLPWYLPEDLKFFKRTTFGKPIIMGRRTYDSIGKPLPGRANIVMSRRPHDLPDGVQGVSSLDEAYGRAEADAMVNGQEEMVIIGGAQIFELALAAADRLYVTHVWAEVEGDAFMPEVNWQNYRVTERSDHKAEGPNPYDYSFVIYDRI